MSAGQAIGAVQGVSRGQLRVPVLFVTEAGQEEQMDVVLFGGGGYGGVG